MPELPEHEARYIRDYVNSQAHDEAGLVQKLGTGGVMGRVHDMYDVHCERSRWWVITEPVAAVLSVFRPYARFRCRDVSSAVACAFTGSMSPPNRMSV